jgi:membrane-associated phospholipid phosphatase
MTSARAPRLEGLRRLASLGLGLLAASFTLGVVLRHNFAGTSLDRWFQRLTVAGARQPGQPGYHHRLAVALTQTARIGTGSALLGFAGIAVVIILAAGIKGGDRYRPARRVWLGLAPVVALGLAAVSMVGNESIVIYPSGHSVTTAAIAFATIAVLVRLRSGRTQVRRRADGWGAVGALVGLVPIAVGLAMAVLRAHFLTDVIGGWLWGGGWGLLTSSLCVSWVERQPKRRRGRRVSSMASAG